MTLYYIIAVATNSKSQATIYSVMIYAFNQYMMITAVIIITMLLVNRKWMIKKG